MDYCDFVLKKYGLEPNQVYAKELRDLLSKEIKNKNSEDNEYLRTLCIQLFSIGYAEDTLLIWQAKNKSFDAFCYIDVELLLGAGYKQTLSFLKLLKTDEAKEELKYILKVNVNDFDKDKQIKSYQEYYGL